MRKLRLPGFVQPSQRPFVFIKAFHIFFVTVAVIAASGVALWCFLTELGRAVEGSTALGTICLIVAVALVVYGVKFLRILRREGI